MLPAEMLLRLVKDSEDVLSRVKRCGSSIELPFKEVYRLELNELVIDLESSRIDAAYEPVMDRGGWYVLYPGTYILVLPRVEFPREVEGLLLPRSSFLRGGWLLEGTKIDAGFRGNLVMLLIGLKGCLHLRKGARVAHMLAWWTSESYDYSREGQWGEKS